MGASTLLAIRSDGGTRRSAEVVYSVWEPSTKTWSYYDGSEAKLEPARGPSSDLGVAPEDALPRLPFGASKIGAGTEARGIVATNGVQIPVMKWGLFALAAYGLWRIVRGS